MKTLDEILNNGEYKKMNAALKARSIELAEKIQTAMEELDIEKIGNYKVIEKSTRSNGGRTDLYVICPEEDDGGYYETYHCLTVENDMNYAGDIYCHIDAATSKERVQFLNDAKGLLTKILNARIKKIEAIEKAISESKNL